MKSKVHFSLYCKIITLAVIALFAIGIATTTMERSTFCLLIAVVAMAVATGLYYCPVCVEADADSVKIHRLLSRPREFKYSDIEAADTCYPSAGGIRLCGSGGFFGYWGYFSDIIIGQYFGYYADRSQCFYIRLKCGRQYVASCENHVAMAAAIESHIENIRATGRDK